MAYIKQQLSYGTAFNDGVRVGNFSGAGYSNGAIGIGLGIDYPYIIRPAAPSATALRPAAAIAGAGGLPLTAGAGVDLVTDLFPGFSAYFFGVARGLHFTGAGTGNPVTFSISGWDYWGHRVVEEVTLAAGNNEAHGSKTMIAVHTIVASGASGGGTVSIGTGNKFGFPYRVPHHNAVLVTWGGALDYQGNPLALQGDFSGADDNAPTATTGDVRGSYAPNPAVAPDGARALVIRMVLDQVDPIYHRGETIPIEKAYGNPQFATGWL